MPGTLHPNGAVQVPPASIFKIRTTCHGKSQSTSARCVWPPTQLGRAIERALEQTLSEGASTMNSPEITWPMMLQCWRTAGLPGAHAVQAFCNVMTITNTPEIPQPMMRHIRRAAGLPGAQAAQAFCNAMTFSSTPEIP
eukprot:1157302-Pelagomonas_calceolata.AAC.19